MRRLAILISIFFMFFTGAAYGQDQDDEPAIKPPALEEAEGRVLLPSAISDLAVGGKGRFFVALCSKHQALAIVDLNKAEVVKEIECKEDNVRFAVGLNHLLVFLPKSRVIQRWSLRTLKLEDKVDYPFEEPVREVRMGSGSRGPVLVGLIGKIREQDRCIFLDPTTLKIKDVDWGKDQLRTANYLRASSDGQFFATRDGTYSEPHKMFLVGLRGNSADLRRPWFLESGFLIPSQGGQHYYSGVGVFSPELAIQHPDKLPKIFPKCHLPAHHGPYCIRLDYKEWGKFGGVVTVLLEGTFQEFAKLEVDDAVCTEPISHGKSRDILLPDQRVHLVPKANLLVTVPKTNNALVLHRFDVEAALEKSKIDYLAITSNPPTTAKVGLKWSYQVQVKAREGALMYRLEKSPTGMTISDAGTITWSVPQDFAAKTADVELTVRNEKERVVRQVFSLTVE